MSTHDPLAGLPLAPGVHGTRAAPGDGLLVAKGLKLVRGRVHEFCGPARQVLAAWAVGAVGAVGAPGRAQGDATALWIRPQWGRERINPHGLGDWADPDRVIVVACPQGRDLLWCAEEALRAGCVALVLVELPAPPALTPVRRLQLAAEAGGARAGGGAKAPVGVLITPGQGGAPGVEGRWHLAPLPPRPADWRTEPVAHVLPPLQARRWLLTRLRARLAPPARWEVEAAPRQPLRLCRVPEAP